MIQKDAGGIRISWNVVVGIVSLITLLSMLSGISNTYAQVEENEKVFNKHIVEFKEYTNKQIETQKSIIRIEVRQEEIIKDLSELATNTREVLRILIEKELATDGDRIGLRE